MALEFLNFGRDKKTNSVLGIDISSASVKLVELSKQRNNFRVESFAVVPLQQGAVVEKSINEIGAVSSAIRKALTVTKTKTKNAVVAVAGSSVITKMVQMDKNLNSDQMETQIALEADQYIPYPLEEVAVDFEIQGPSTEAGFVDVLVAACRRENVDARVDVLAEAGLRARVVDLEAYAIERVCGYLNRQSPLDSQAVTAIVDMGASMTTLNVIEKGNVIYMREQLFGGRLLTEDVQRRFSMSFEEAELAQINHDLPEEYTIEILEPFKASVIQHVSRALQFFFSSGKHQSVDRIMLAGGIAQLEGISDLLEMRLGVPTEILNPFAGMDLAYGVNSQALQKVAPSLLIASGLAMRNC